MIARCLTYVVNYTYTEVVIDIATLTSAIMSGSMVHAAPIAAFSSTDEDLADAID